MAIRRSVPWLLDGFPSCTPRLLQLPLRHCRVLPSAFTSRPLAPPRSHSQGVARSSTLLWHSALGIEVTCIRSSLSSFTSDHAQIGTCFPSSADLPARKLQGGVPPWSPHKVSQEVSPCPPTNCHVKFHPVAQNAFILLLLAVLPSPPLCLAQRCRCSVGACTHNCALLREQEYAKFAPCLSA